MSTTVASVKKVGIVGDEMGSMLIAHGLVTNSFCLDNNRALAVPDHMELPAPWNLPSRLFQFPIEVGDIENDTRTLGLIHPALGEHPYVKHVATTLNVSFSPDGAPNRNGYSKSSLGQWWHAVDLISSGHWRELLQTRQFTTNTYIARAVRFGLDYSPTANQRNRVGPTEARIILQAIGAAEPLDRAATLRELAEPSPCRQDGGATHWPINDFRRDNELSLAWGRIFGIEKGWFAYGPGGHLQWAQRGRDQFASSSSESYVESSTGQTAFAF